MPSIDEAGRWVVLLLGGVLLVIAVARRPAPDGRRPPTTLTLVFAFLLTGTGAFGPSFIGMAKDFLDSTSVTLREAKQFTDSLYGLMQKLSEENPDSDVVQEQTRELLELVASENAPEGSLRITSAVLSDAIRSGALPAGVDPLEALRAMGADVDPEALTLVQQDLTEAVQAREAILQARTQLREFEQLTLAFQEVEQGEPVNELTYRRAFENSLGSDFSLERTNQSLDALLDSPVFAPAQ